MQVTIIVIISKTVSGIPVGNAIRSIITQMLITGVILLAEAIVYRLLQHRLDRMQWVWAHISSLYFLVLVLPFIIILLNIIVRRRFNSWDQFEWIRKLNLLRNLLFWSILLVGHLFFVLTIVRGFSKKRKLQEDQNDSSNLLDEFPS
jgi:hypothetical protein